MAVRKVRIYPDPCLKEVARPVEALTDEVLEVCQDLVDTMAVHERCVGLAAPQIGVSLRIVSVDVSSHPRGAEANHGHIVLINPQILEKAKFEMGREGCLSLPRVTANIKRAKRIVFRAQTPSGGILSTFTSNFEARAIQHEIDHLDGVLILDRAASPSEIFHREG